MKKILMLNNEFPPLGGGQANANFFALKELEAYPDLQIDLVTASENQKKQEKFNKNSEIYYLDISKKGKNIHFQTIFDLIKYSWKAFFQSRKLIKQKKYDGILCWSGLPAGFLGYALNKLYKVPYIVLLRGSDVPFYEKRWQKLDKFIFSWLSPIIWKNAKQVIANSDGLRELAHKTAPKQEIGLIYNGVDTDFFKPDLEKKNKKPIIISVGRLVERKNFSLLIQACEGLDVIVQIIGDGPEKENLINLAKKLKVDLDLTGIIKNKQKIAKKYAKADIFVLSSKNEGMSNAVLEGMASGLPCVVSDTGGSKELVQDKENGFIVGIESADELSKKIKEFLKNPQKILTMGKNSRQKAEKMSWRELAKKFSKLF